MDIRTRYLLIALGIVGAIVVLATLLLPRKARIALYLALILGAGGVAGYIKFVRDFLPTEYALETTVSGLSLPVFALPDPLDSDRWFVLEKFGKIRITEGALVKDEPFLDLSEKVAGEGGEQGLLSMVFHPDATSNGFYYLLYTAKPDDMLILARYQRSLENPDQTLIESEEVLLEIPQPSTHHNGGHLEFGPDGYLYASIGDGAGGGFPGDAQDLTNLLGTMVRLDVSDPVVNPVYLIPADNPFVGQPDALPEIWSFGLRNPWRFDFDPVDGDLFITDVGEQAQEEVNYSPAGKAAAVNYGWKYYEGSERTNKEAPYPPEDSFAFPLAEYNHMSLGGCSIIGGYVYRGVSLPELDGKFLYTDYCSSFIWAIDAKENGKHDVDLLMRDTSSNFVSFAKSDDGELFLVDLREGRLRRLVKK